MNSAARLLNVISKLLAHPVDTQTLCHVVWANVFELGSGPEDKHDAVISTLQAIRAEIDLTTTALEAKGITPALYVDQFNRLRTVVSPAYFNASWSGLVGTINQPDTRLAIAWAAEVLPDNESEVSIEERSALLDEVSALLATLDGADLPPAVRSFIGKQLKNIQASLRMYDVRGVKVVAEAIEQFAGAAMVARSTLKSEVANATPAARGFMARANGLVTKVVNVLELAEKVKKGSGALIEMADAVRIAIENMPTGGG